MNLPIFFDAVQTNLLSPAILFFLLGILATFARSDLRIPEPIYMGLTIYLLTAIGFKGGAAVAEAGLGAVWAPTLAAFLIGGLIPLWTYPILRFIGRLSVADSAAMSAHYGSVSAVTFIAATNFLTSANQPFEEYTSAFLAVMESPAIVMGILLGKKFQTEPSAGKSMSLGPSLKEALAGRSVILLVGALVIGFLSGEKGLESTSAFFVAPFQGVLALFLLEMGMVAARRFSDLKKIGLFLVFFGTLIPIFHGILGVALGLWVNLSLGGAMLLGVLASSASYIAAPAAMRLSLPEANPTLYLTASLAVTFPFNITLGLPLYYSAAKYLFGADL